jgi:hypothetical protein
MNLYHGTEATGELYEGKIILLAHKNMYHRFMNGPAGVTLHRIFRKTSACRREAGCN